MLKYKVLILCTGNSARSQMAEGLMRHHGGDIFQVFSAGVAPTRIRDEAVQVMGEIGIDISEQFSKSVDRFVADAFNYIITVCDRAKESCPVFPGDPVRIHWSFLDPAAVDGSEEERYKAFQETSVQMMTRISYLLLVIRREYGLSLD